jgi:hypothetical protein
VFISGILANMTQVSDVAPGPLVRRKISGFVAKNRAQNLVQVKIKKCQFEDNIGFFYS